MRSLTRSSGLQTSSGSVSNGASILAGIMINGDGANDLTITIYDNASAASGLVLFKGYIVATTDSRSGFATFEPNVKAENGIYVDIATAGTAEYIVYSG